MREIGRDGEMTFVSSSQTQTSIVVRPYWNFIRIHPIVFTTTEIQTRYVYRQNTSMPHSNVLHVSVHSNRHWVPLPQNFKEHKYLYRGPGSSVSIATAYGLDGPGIESRWGRDFPH